MDAVSKPEGIIGNINRQTFGRKLGCALCGEIRHLWPDGTVEVVIEAKKVIRKNDESTTGNPNNRPQRTTGES